VTGTCLVVMYHYVRDAAATPFPEIRALPPAAFSQQLDWLQQHYHVLRPDELEAALDNHATLPDKAALLTFDDGFADHGDAVATELLRRGLSAIVFVSGDAASATPRVLPVHKTQFLLARLGASAFERAVLERWASTMPAGRLPRVFGDDGWEHPDERAVKHLLHYELPFELADGLLGDLFREHIGDETAFARDLYLDEARVTAMARQGIVFGYHTRSHRMLSRLSREEQRRELHDGVAWIRRLTGQRWVPFCYPWGGPATYTDETIALLAEHGYSMAFNTVRRRAEIGRDGRFELPRVDARDLPPYTQGEPGLEAAGG